MRTRTWKPAWQRRKRNLKPLLLNPTDARPECKSGDIELWRSSSATALDHYQRALKLHVDAECAKPSLAGLLIEEGKVQQVLGYLQSAERSDPYDAQVHHRLAALYRSMGQNQEADRELSAFQDLDKLQSQLERALPSGTTFELRAGSASTAAVPTARCGGRHPRSARISLDGAIPCFWLTTVSSVW